MQIIKIAVAAFLLGVITGCASLGGAPGNEKLLTQYAVLKFVEQAENPADRAEKIKTVVSDLKTFLDSEPVNLLQLEAAVMERAELEGLSPADRLLANALINNVVEEIRSRVGTKVDAEAIYQINTVLSWVESVL